MTLKYEQRGCPENIRISVNSDCAADRATWYSAFCSSPPLALAAFQLRGAAWWWATVRAVCTDTLSQRLAAPLTCSPRHSTATVGGLLATLGYSCSGGVSVWVWVEGRRGKKGEEREDRRSKIIDNNLRRTVLTIAIQIPRFSNRVRTSSTISLTLPLVLDARTVSSAGCDVFSCSVARSWTVTCGNVRPSVCCTKLCMLAAQVTFSRSKRKSSKVHPPSNGSSLILDSSSATV